MSFLSRLRSLFRKPGYNGLYRAPAPEPYDPWPIAPEINATVKTNDDDRCWHSLRRLGKAPYNGICEVCKDGPCPRRENARKAEPFTPKAANETFAVKPHSGDMVSVVDARDRFNSSWE